VIRTWADEDARVIFNRGRPRRFAPELLRVARRKLVMLDAATTIDDLRIPPANRLEKLKGTRSGQYSIRINDQWRVCFEWKEGNAYAVEIVDYY
jgi:proteic killer suppression protein